MGSKRLDLSKRSVAAIEKEIKTLEAELARRQRRQEQGQAKSIDALVAFAQSYKYNFPETWAAYVVAGRERRRLHREQGQRGTSMSE